MEVSIRPVRQRETWRVRGGTLAAWHVAGLAACTALTATAVVANRLYGQPFYTGAYGGRLDIIAVNVTAGAAGNLRLGIYANDPATNLPGALLYDSGDIDTTVAAVKSIDPNFDLPPNTVVWLAVVFSAAPTIRTIPIASAEPFLGLPAAMGTAPQCGLYAPHVYAALPATFNLGGAFVAVVAAPIPAIAVHIE